MDTSQLTAHQIFSVLRRRRRLFLLPLIVIVAVSTLGAFLLPRKYSSFVTILFQREEILNPLVSFSMAVTLASDDRLKALDEVVYSQKTVQKLIDELGFAEDPIRTEEDRQTLIKEIRKRITTERPGASSVRISFLDEDPRRAQKAVSLLSDFTISTLLQVENRRNEMAVKFFEDKLNELRTKFEESREVMVSVDRERIENVPTEERMLPMMIQEVEDELRSIDERLSGYERGLSLLRNVPEVLASDEGRRSLRAIARLSLPYAGNLSELATTFEGLSLRYTAKYPEVQKLETQIRGLLAGMQTAAESELSLARKSRADAEQRRVRMIQSLKTASVTARMDQDKESSYGIYRKMYDEMKVKLEQAKTMRDLGHKAEDSFTILDPPLIPTEPTKPNRMLIILGGIALGCFVGLMTVGAAEALDTTVRTRSDVASFQKPIVAFIPDGRIIRGRS